MMLIAYKQTGSSSHFALEKLVYDINSDHDQHIELFRKLYASERKTRNVPHLTAATFCSIKKDYCFSP
jgi:hypothetical protein